MEKLIIATRKSALAMWQSEYIKEQICSKFSIEVGLVGQKTKGDVILDTPLAKIGGKGLFTKELEEIMLRNEAHIAVHSLKDVPMEFPAGLVLGAISARADVRDAFVSQKFTKFDELPKGARVGTTSLRRKMQLLMMRPDLDVISLRGNVNTRLNRLDAGEFDAIILAMAGISRLNLGAQISYVVPFEVAQMIPAMGQGALGIECVNRAEILEKIAFLNDENALIETTIEREFIRALNGGCQVPIGINARMLENSDKIDVRAVVGLPDGSEFIRENRTINRVEFKEFGAKFGAEFIEKGAKELLIRAEKMV